MASTGFLDVPTTHRISFIDTLNISLTMRRKFGEWIMFRKFKLTWETAFIVLFFIVGSVVALSTSLNDLDSNLHLDYVREIQKTHSIPKYHPHLFNTEGIQVPFPYPIGYHLAMSIFPHWVPLYKVLHVAFAAMCLILTLKLADLLGVKKNKFAVLIPLVLAFSFSKYSITPHLDVFALMLVLLSAYFMLKYVQEDKKVYAFVAILSGFYGSMAREFALVTILFASLAFLLKYTGKWRRIVHICLPMLFLTAMGYYLVNCSIRGQHLLYPFLGKSDPGAWEWYTTHNSFWSVLRYEYAQALGEILIVFSLFLPIFLLTRPRDKTLAFIFGCQIAFTFIFLPSTGGLRRYVMFTLPFLAIAYANALQKFSKRTLAFILLLGMFILYPAQGYALEKDFPTNFEGVAENLGPNDSVLFRKYGQLAYKTGCKANWTSLFWSSDLFESFENVDKVENLIEKHGITHVLIDKYIIVRADSPMIGDEAVGYPEKWVEKIENIGMKISETQRYVLYRVGSP